MIRIATRRSPLARWQADWVAAALRDAGHEVKLVLLTSEGDVNQQTIDGSQTVGLFTKRIQQAVLSGEADVAVHSLKDLPTQLDTGLELVAVPTRAPVADCLITADGISFEQLPAGARLGTGSRRRAAQMLSQRADLQIEAIRGNVQTRLEKLAGEGFDGVILAEAGLLRLGLENHTAQRLSLDWMLPAPGQGALGLEIRPDDQLSKDALQTLNSHSTFACVTAERAVLRELKAGCLAPVAALARVENATLTLRAAVLSLDGQTRLETTAAIDCPQPEMLAAEALGVKVAESLLDQGAGPLIAAAR